MDAINYYVVKLLNKTMFVSLKFVVRFYTKSHSKCPILTISTLNDQTPSLIKNLVLLRLLSSYIQFHLKLLGGMRAGLEPKGVQGGQSNSLQDQKHTVFMRKFVKI